MLNTVDFSLALDLDTYQKLLRRYQKELQRLASQAYVMGKPVVIVFEGCPLSGRSDVIRCLAEGLDPRGFFIYSGEMPTESESNRHYLWQFWMHLPKAGQIAIYDRSWYGRVMDERLVGHCSEEQCKRAYREINNFERQILDAGTIITKFWLHIDRQEHARRLETLPDEESQHPGDWCRHDNWEIYEDAANEMLLKTSTTKAPWTVVESNSELYARIKALKTLVVHLKVALQVQTSKAVVASGGIKKKKKKKKRKKK